MYFGEMNLLSILVQLIFAWVATDYLITLLKRSKLNPKRQPPGPLPLPIVGNLFSLGKKPHKSLAELAKVYGPVMLLKIGYKPNPVIVVSSPAMAQEVLKTKDASFSARTVVHALTALDHHLSSVGLLPPDARWRAFRKICAMQIFANKRLDATQHLRRKQIPKLISFVEKCCKTGEAVNIGEAAFVTSMNSLTNTFFSVDLVDLGSEGATGFKELIWSIIKLGAAPDVANYFPLLKKVDPQGTKKRMTAYFNRMFLIFDGIIQQRLELRKSAAMNDHQIHVTPKNDILDAMLDSTDLKDFNISDVPHLLLDLFAAGTETTPSTVEWAMTELLRNPEKMRKVQMELQEVIGEDKQVEENDHLRLPYLRAVVKETFRLHPPTPLFLPRKVISDTQLGEFKIAKNTEVLVNAWAIGRDPKLWANVDVFEPERFLDSSVDYVGQDFELIPFGSGRRVCPGMPLASRMLHLILGTLIHSVNWKLEDGMKPEDIDVDDRFGISIQKAKPLCVIPFPKPM